MIKPGMIGFSSNARGWLPTLIKFFTGSNWSHSFIISHNFGNFLSVQEADMLITITPLERYIKSKTEIFQLYELTGPSATSENINNSLDYCFNEYQGVRYGFFQLIWFTWRWFNQKILKRDVRNEKNWFTDGIICSELVYDFLYQLGGEYKDLFKDYNQDTIQPEDIYQIALANPTLFKKV